MINVTDRVTYDPSVQFSFGCSIGTEAEHATVSNDETKVVIGAEVRIREFVTVNCGISQDTIIGPNCYLLAKSHVGHDSILGNGVVLSTGSIIGGHSVIGDHTYVGLNATTHQYAKLGPYCIVGANSFFKGESPAGITWGGVPAKPLKVNLIGIERHCPPEDKAKVIDEANEFINNYRKQKS